MTEPTIIVGNTLLSRGQAMAVRVAINNFLIELQDDAALGDDEHGRAMVAAYRAQLVDVLLMMQP